MSGIEHCPQCGEIIPVWAHDYHKGECPARWPEVNCVEFKTAEDCQKAAEYVRKVNATLIRYREALEKLAKGNRAPSVLSIAKEALKEQI